MAVRGRKPKATHLHLVEGTHRRDRHGAGDVMSEPEDAIARPKGLRGKAAQLWDQFIARAAWLTWADGPKALIWCHLQAEFERKPGEMVASRIAQLRALGSELGLEPASRARIGAGRDDADRRTDPADEFLA